MRKLILLIVLCTCGLFSQPTTAQVSFRANISLQPIWGPVGYDHVEYYYLPEVDAYYYVPTHMFFYMENGRWVNRPELSGRYRNFDLYRTRKIVVNEPRPYLRDNVYKMKYANQRGYTKQMLIRDSRDSKYFEIKDHPEHSKWKGNNDNRNNMNNRDNRNQNMNMNKGQNMNMNKNQNMNMNKNKNQNQKKNHDQGNSRENK